MTNTIQKRVTIILLGVTMCAVSFSQTSDRPRNVMPMLAELKDPKIIVRKSKRRLEVYDRGNLVTTFTVVLGFAPIGDKEIEGDGKTPEGEFYVFTKNTESKYHLSLGLSYPAKEDAERGLEAGLISKKERDEIVSAIDAKKMPPQKTRLGGEIFIHGGGTERDWTWGCVALKNEEIEELFRVIPVGTKVTIVA